MSAPRANRLSCRKVNACLILLIAGAGGPLLAQADDGPTCSKYAIQGIEVGMSHREVWRRMGGKGAARELARGPRGPFSIAEYAGRPGTVVVEYDRGISGRIPARTVLVRQELSSRTPRSPELLIAAYGEPIRGAAHLESRFETGSTYWVDLECGVVVSVFRKRAEWWAGGVEKVCLQVESIRRADAELVAAAREKQGVSSAASKPAPEAAGVPREIAEKVTPSGTADEDAVAPASSAVAPGGEADIPEEIDEVEDRLPIRRIYSAPIYPQRALTANATGEVELELEILESGQVGDIRVLRSSRERMGFEAAAVQAARKWRYEPALRGGVPAPARIRVIVNFEDLPMEIAAGVTPTETADQDAVAVLTLSSATEEGETDGTKPADVVDVADTPPVRRKYSAPVFPRRALNANATGEVELELEILESGRVGEIRVLSLSRERMGFDGAAIQAARKWRYDPALRGGVPVPARIRVVVKFDK